MIHGTVGLVLGPQEVIIVIVVAYPVQIGLACHSSFGFVGLHAICARCAIIEKRPCLWNVLRDTDFEGFPLPLDVCLHLIPELLVDLEVLQLKFAVSLVGSLDHIFWGLGYQGVHLCLFDGALLTLHLLELLFEFDFTINSDRWSLMG